MQPRARLARSDDAEALVRLRMENGRVHALLDPAVYRVPDLGKVREHFTARLTENDPDSVMFVGVDDDVVLGLAEIALDPVPPPYQILKPLLSAHVHLVVAEQARGLSLGSTLLEAAQAWAVGRGVRRLVAVIQRDNDLAQRFYGSRGYQDQGVICFKELSEPSQ